MPNTDSGQRQGLPQPTEPLTLVGNYNHHEHKTS